VALAARRPNRGPRIVRSWDRLAPWWPWSVGPGPGAGGRALVALVALDLVPGPGARPWCPALVPVAAWSRSWCPARAAGAGGRVCVCMSPGPVFVCPGPHVQTPRAAQLGPWPVAVGRVAWAVAAGSRALARGQRPGHPGAQKTGRARAARALARFYTVSFT